MDKRSQILSAAEELFAEKGFEGTTVRDIAHQANVNLAMISYYFGSKEKLFESLIEYRSGYVAGMLEDLAGDQSRTPMEKMHQLIDMYVDRIFNNFRFHNIISAHFSAAHSSDIKEVLIRMKTKNLEQIRKIIDEGIQKGVFRQVDLELTVASLIGTISQMTLSREFYCRLMGLPPLNADMYTPELAERLKAHLKDMLTAHLTYNPVISETIHTK